MLHGGLSAYHWNVIITEMTDDETQPRLMFILSTDTSVGVYKFRLEWLRFLGQCCGQVSSSDIPIIWTRQCFQQYTERHIILVLVISSHKLGYNTAALCKAFHYEIIQKLKHSALHLRQQRFPGIYNFRKNCA